MTTVLRRKISSLKSASPAAKPYLTRRLLPRRTRAVAHARTRSRVDIDRPRVDIFFVVVVVVVTVIDRKTRVASSSSSNRHALTSRRAPRRRQRHPTRRGTGEIGR
jgi:hypothetical protein